MSYLTVITLERAKIYLRIDDTQSETDDEITSMINSVCSFLEKKTNHIFFDRNKEYDVSCGKVRVYDYPINSVVSPADPEDVTAAKKTMYTDYCVDTETETITLNVGYTDPLDIPNDLIDAALQMLKVFYYEAEKQVNTTLIPESVKEIINVNRRFFV